jgi:hypothetical protein
MDLLGCDLADLDNVVGFDDGVLCVLGHGLVEVVLGLAELAVAEPVGLVDLDQCVVTEDGFFQDVSLAVEFAGFLGFRVFCNRAVLVVADGEFTGLY